jgi:hypothetical protein
MDAYAVERSPSSNEMLRLVAGLQSALTLEEVERAYLACSQGKPRTHHRVLAGADSGQPG